MNPDFSYMVFNQDKLVDGKVTYLKNVVYKIPQASVERWIKRGGVVLTDAEGKELFSEQQKPSKGKKTGNNTKSKEGDETSKDDDGENSGLSKDSDNE